MNNAKFIYSKEEIDFVDSIEENQLRSMLLHHVRLFNLANSEAKSFENKCNTLSNIILDISEKYPDVKVPTMGETIKKHGELESYLKMKNRS